MKKTILSATFLVAGALSMLGQGELDFSNAYWWEWPATDNFDRRVYKSPGVPVDNAAWAAQLFQFNNGQWEVLSAKSFFFGAGDLAGYWDWDGTKYTAAVSTLAVGIFDETGTMVYRGGGALPGGQDRPSFSYTKANPPIPTLADTLLIGLGAITVPEPSTIALGVLGLGALLLFRRRK